MKKDTLIDTEKDHKKESLVSFTVVKRNGKLVPFQRTRILNAIIAAFKDTKNLSKDSPLDSDIKKMIHLLTDNISSKLLKLASKGASLTVEGIQDFVEVTLMKKGHHDVARDYIVYRDQQKHKRENSVQNLKIYRQDRATLVRFNPMKIASSLEKCFRRTHQIENQTPDDIIQTINHLTEEIVEDSIQHTQKTHALYVDWIQDTIEQKLMKKHLFSEAKDFILHRAKKETHSSLPPTPTGKERTFNVVCDDGSKKTITERFLKNKISFACRGLEKDVDQSDLINTAILNFYDGIKEHELDQANIYAARSRIEKDPAYSQVTSRLLLDVLYRETLQISSSDTSLKKVHRSYFKKYISKGISLERLHSDLLDYDLSELANAIDLDRDDLFSYLGLQTLYDRYFIHEEEKKLETPQIFWMRVAMGLAIKEKDKNKRAIEFYNVLSTFSFVSSTPTLFNSGTKHQQLSSCYLSTVQDDLHSIFKIISDDAQLSKWAGGLGNDWTSVRATGSVIKGTNGKSQGVIPFLKVANDTAVAVNQCFSPDTLVYTGKGPIPISEVQVKDLVLGISGTYREVTEKCSYNQKDPMLTIEAEHFLTPLCVTDGHPFYAIQNKEKKCAWVDAKNLKEGDYIAQVVPKEIVKVDTFQKEDATFYGLLLAEGHLDKEGNCRVSSKTKKIKQFVCSYLEKRGLSYHIQSDEIQWTQSHVRNATYDTVESFVDFPIFYEDLYNEKGNKCISSRLSHLPHFQVWALVEALCETCSHVVKEKIHFDHSSTDLRETFRYQLLRLGIPTSASQNTLVLPITKEIAEKMNCTVQEEKNWFLHLGHIFTRIQSVKQSPITPFVYDLKVEGDASYMTTSALAHNGGKRKGAMCAYLETWHLDIEDFLELRKNTGDERRRTHDMNTANWIPDLFMKRVQENGMWTLFTPSITPDLHDLYGNAFESRYLEYEKMADEGKMKLFKKVEAVQLWRKMLSMLFETGHPWITFKDPSNIRSSQDHVGVVHSSNLCTEILLNTSEDETAVCNLGSINLTEHFIDQKLDETKLASTVRTAIRMLDNVIDINFYPIPDAKNANLRHRPVGLGMMGFQDALYMKNLSYTSSEAIEFADTSMEMISYYAILASTELAEERGSYSTYKGSKWDRGLLPIDTIDLLEKERGSKITVNRQKNLDWEKVRQEIKKHGMRNSNTMAIAPTATIANISNITPSIEPIYKHLFVKSNLSGEFTIVNPHLVSKLKELNIWDEEMIDDLKYFDGSIFEIERIPENVKKMFPTAFEVEPDWLIECAARRQKWIDMGQSLNLYLAEPDGKKLSQMYFLSWEKGLKTNYYLRTLAATQIEKSSIDINKRGLQPRWMKNQSASSNIKVDRNKTVCNLEEGCESCQ